MIEIIPNWHPILVHYTVALLTISALFFLLSKFAVNWRLEDQWLGVGYWTLWIGFLITVGTVIAGFLAFNSVNHDTESHKVMLEHRNLALGTLGVFLVLAVWAIFSYRAKKEPSIFFILVILLGTVSIFSTAWHGGELVYRHGMGVQRLPNPDDHAHAGGAGHDHGAPADAAGDGHAHDQPHEHGTESSGEAGDDGHAHDQPHDHSASTDESEHQSLDAGDTEAGGETQPEAGKPEEGQSESSHESL